MSKDVYAAKCYKCGAKGSNIRKDTTNCPRCKAPVRVIKLCNDTHCNSCGISAHMNDDCRANW